MDANGVNWRMVLANEGETCQAMMNFDAHEVGEIVFLPNRTLQVFGTNYYGNMPYEIDVEDTNIDWIDHISRKTWATEDMLRAIGMALRVANMFVHPRDYEFYNDGYTKSAVENRIEEWINGGTR